MSPAAKRSSSKRSGKTPAPTPAAFFEVACPRVLSSLRSLCQERGGRFAIVVDGEGGGAWTLDFARVLVERGKAGADVTVTLSPAQFASFATGKTELRKLVKNGEAGCEGDTSRIEDLSLVLAFLSRG